MIIWIPRMLDPHHQDDMKHFFATVIGWGVDPSDNADFETWTPWKDVARLLVKIRIRKNQSVFIYGYESHLQSKLFTHLQLEHNHKLMNCQDDNSKNYPSSNDDGRNPRYNTVNFHLRIKNRKPDPDHHSLEFCPSAGICPTVEYMTVISIGLPDFCWYQS